MAYSEMLLHIVLLVDSPLISSSFPFLHFPGALLDDCNFLSLLSSHTLHSKSTVGSADHCSTTFSLVAADDSLVCFLLGTRCLLDGELFLSFCRRRMAVEILSVVLV